MGQAIHAGRTGRPWLRMRQYVFHTKGDVCCWCGHPGAGDINHDDGWANSPETRMDPDRMSPIHGVYGGGCPYCPWVWSRKLGRMAPVICNSVVGKQPLAVALAKRARQQAARSLDW